MSLGYAPIPTSFSPVGSSINVLLIFRFLVQLEPFHFVSASMKMRVFTWCPLCDFTTLIKFTFRNW
uniref:MAR-binding protein n=1 Tax=Solanum tuberosum TaxID=4113 RepID=M1BF87_SOLTU